jgi:hypothetical protein
MTDAEGAWFRCVRKLRIRGVRGSRTRGASEPVNTIQERSGRERRNEPLFPYRSRPRGVDNP